MTLSLMSLWELKSGFQETDLSSRTDSSVILLIGRRVAGKGQDKKQKAG